jgi:hypothetical protein
MAHVAKKLTVLLAVSACAEAFEETTVDGFVVRVQELAVPVLSVAVSPSTTFVAGGRDAPLLLALSADDVLAVVRLPDSLTQPLTAVTARDDAVVVGTQGGEVVRIRPSTDPLTAHPAPILALAPWPIDGWAILTADGVEIVGPAPRTVEETGLVALSARGDVLAAAGEGLLRLGGADPVRTALPVPATDLVLSSERRLLGVGPARGFVDTDGRLESVPSLRGAVVALAADGTPWLAGEDGFGAWRGGSRFERLVGPDDLPALEGIQWRDMAVDRVGIVAVGVRAAADGGGDTGVVVRIRFPPRQPGSVSSSSS